MTHDPPSSWYQNMPYSRTIARYLWWGLAERTRKSYQSATKGYVMSCAILGKSPFPATLETLLAWVAEMGERRILPKTIKLYLMGVRSFQVDMGTRKELDIFHHPTLERVIQGIRRLRGEPDVKERLPITRPILLNILATFNTRTQTGATFHAAFCLAFAGFLRMGEFTWSAADQHEDFSQWHMTRKSITLEEDRIYVQLPASKTDPFRQGVKLTIAAARDEACALKSLRRLLSDFPTSSQAPLFDTEKGFTRQYATNILRNTLSRLGYRGNYSGHSFRRGAATSASESGLSENEIMALGRWKSDSFKLYIQTNPERIVEASRRHQQQ